MPGRAAGAPVISWPFFLAATALLGAAAWRDVATRTIPDPVCGLLAAAGFASRCILGGTEAVLSLAVALILFVVLLAVALRGLMGGGDVKLAVAMAVGLPPALAWDFVFATAMVGGLLGLGYLAGPWLVARPQQTGQAMLLRRIARVEAWRVRRRGPVPYGVAIAGGGILVMLAAPGG
jgi:prepilin peptidase CpaA